MPDLSQTFADPEFRRLPATEKIKIMTAVDPEFGSLGTEDQVKVLFSGLHPGVAKPPAPDKGFWSTLGSDLSKLPLGVMQTIFAPASLGQATAEGIKDQAAKTRESFRSKDYVEAGGHALATLLPLIGPVAAEAGTDIGEGRTGQGLARATELLAPPVVAEVAPVLGAAASATGEGIKSVATVDNAIAAGKFIRHPLRSTFQYGAGKLADALESKYRPPVQDFEFKPGSGKNMPKYPGPQSVGTQAPGTMIPRGKFTPPPEEVPYQPGNLKNVPKFTPGDNPYAGAPGTQVPRGSFVPPEELPPEPYKFTPSARTKSLLRSPGAENPYQSPSYRSRGQGPRPQASEVLPGPGAEPGAPPSGPAPRGGAPASGKYSSGVSQDAAPLNPSDLHEYMMAQGRIAKAADLTAQLQSEGIKSLAQLKKLSPADRAALASRAKVRLPSQVVWDLVEKGF